MVDFWFAKRILNLRTDFGIFVVRANVGIDNRSERLHPIEQVDHVTALQVQFVHDRQIRQCGNHLAGVVEDTAIALF